MSNNPNLPVPIKPIESRILLIRGQKVILDADLAELYGVKTKRLNEQVARNKGKFPSEFMFRLTSDEYQNLRSQFATSRSWGGRRYMPFAFTEFGALQAASILNSPQADEMSVFIIRAFVKLREMLVANSALTMKLAELEKKVGAHDAALKTIIEAIRQLMTPPQKTKRRIGFGSPAQSGGGSEP